MKGLPTKASETRAASAALSHVRHSSALIIIDMMNLFEFPGGDTLAKNSRPAAQRIAALKRRYQEAAAPVIYINDNFMDWKADFKEIVTICSHASAVGAPIAQQLLPARDDYFVLKPKHSAFHSTPLALLLAKLDVRRLVLTGIAADACVLASAQDANMYEYEVQVPRDCVAALTNERRDRALAIMKDSFGADIGSSRRIKP